MEFFPSWRQRQREKTFHSNNVGNAWKKQKCLFSPPFLSRMCGKEGDRVCYSSSPFDLSSNSSSYEIIFRAKDNLREQKLSCHQSRASF